MRIRAIRLATDNRPLSPLSLERGKTALVLFLVILCVGTLAAFAHWYLGDERRRFVNDCLRNHINESQCLCTFAAYKRLDQPYSDLAKASVHSSSEGYRNAVISVVLRKATQVGVGFDPGNLAREIQTQPRDRILRAALNVLARHTTAHKWKLVGQVTGVGQAMMVWWSTFLVAFEATHAVYIVEQECGGPFTSSWATAAQVWTATKEAVVSRWIAVRSASQQLWAW